MWLGVDLRTDTKNLRHMWLRNIGLRAQTDMLTILGSIVDMMGGTCLTT